MHFQHYDYEKQSTVQPVLSRHLRDNKNLLAKTGACLIQVHFNVFACFGNWMHACLIQVACLKEMATKTGFTVVLMQYSLCAPISPSVCACVLTL